MRQHYRQGHGPQGLRLCGGRHRWRGDYGRWLLRLCRLLLGKGIGAAASIPGNLVQAVMGLVIGLMLFFLLKRSKALDKLNLQW